MKALVIRRMRVEDGATLVEFSLVVFLLVMVLLGVMEMGRMVLVYNTMADSARSGARYAIVHGSDCVGSGLNGASGPGNTAQVESIVEAYAGAGLLDTSQLTVTVSYPDGDNKPGSSVTVAVAYTYDPLVGYFSSVLNKTMSSTSQGRITY